MAQQLQERPAGTPLASAGTLLATPSTSTSTTAVRTAGHNGVDGTTRIADSVVARISGLAAREVAGVHDLTPTGLTQSFGSIAGRVTGQNQPERGVAVQVGEVECIVDLNIVVDYGASIPQLAEAMRRNLSNRLHAMTGLQAKEVNINVADLYFPGQEEPQQQPAVR
jgi:uncharacterized alkaline shock family protein YloU